MEKARLAAQQKQHNLEMARVEDQEEDQEELKMKTPQKQKAVAPYRTPEFVWSRVHIRLLDDLLNYIEKVVEEWADSAIPMVDHVSFL